MTNPRVVVNSVIDKAATKELRNRGPLTNEEIDLMLSEANKIEQDYFRLRVKALIGLVKKFGKRRSEVASLEREKKESLILWKSINSFHNSTIFGISFSMACRYSISLIICYTE